jgi:hypothetical protein
MRAILMAILLTLAAKSAPAQHGFEIGKLECVLVDTRNLIIRSEQTFDCEFLPISGEPETYTGRMTRTGVDLTVRRRFVMIWAVLSPTEVARAPGSLAGTFVGGGADVALGLGFGAQALVGGGSNAFTLQPLSIAGVVGAGASLAVTRFVLE